MSNLLIVLATALLIILSIVFNLQIKTKYFCVSLYWIFALIGAIIIIGVGAVDFAELKSLLFSHKIMNPTKILILFLSLTSISVLLDECGFFSYLANAVSKKANTSQTKLFVYFYLIISTITIFTSNDIVILTFTPFICYFAKNVKINPIPYIVAEFVAANTWSMLLLIGNPTNIYIASSLSVDFLDYFLTMALPTIFAGITSFAILFLLFRKQLKKPIATQTQEAKFCNKTLNIVGLCFLAVTIVLVAISNYIKIEMWIITLCLATLMFVVFAILLLAKKQKLTILFSTAKRLPYSLIPFLLSFFVMIYSVEKSGLITTIANALDNGSVVFSLGFLSLFSANLLNNIPMTIFFTEIVCCLSNSTAGLYAVVIGSNIGAFLTPIGALAGIMFMNILRKNDIKFSFFDFMKYGFAIALPTISASLFGLWLVV